VERTHRKSPSFLRRLAIAVVAASLLAAGIAGCGDDDSDNTVAKAGTPAGEQQGQAASEKTSDHSPIKIGVILSYTGPFGLYGKPMETVLRARLAKAGDEAGGRPIELIFEDDATDANSAVSKATKLVEQDKVAAVVCCVGGAATLAVGPVLAEKKIPQLGPIPNPAGLEKYATAAMAAPTAGHDATELGTYAAKKLGYKTAVVVASDFSYGHEVADGFKKGFTDAGGKVVQDVFAPLGTADFGSYLSRVEDADVAFGGFAGADAIKFVQQYQQFGVKKRMPLIGHGPLVTELVLKAIGDAAQDVGAGFYYSSTLKTPDNTAFLDALKPTPQVIPSHFTAGAWATGSVLIDAINRMKGDVSDGLALAKAIRATNIPAPWGTLKFDTSTGYAEAPTYYYVVKGAGATLHHEIVEEMS
jgi:branched-chain amino acid transport system substrate-binding protein